MATTQQTIAIYGVTPKTAASGKLYWAISTNLGFMNCFEAEIANNLNLVLGKDPITCSVSENEKGYKTITRIGSEMAKPAVIADNVNKFAKASGIKQTSMYVSYVKDLIVAGQDFQKAIEMIKKAKSEFE